jgi:hypothetical protein
MARMVYFREIYFYIVCLTAIIIFVIGIVMTYEGVINYIKPTTYMTRAYELPMYQERETNLTKEEIDTMVEEEIKISLENEKAIAFKNLLRGALLIVIAIVLFAFHWRKAQAMWAMSLESRQDE